MEEINIDSSNINFYEALRWIVTIFTANSIDYLLVGGTAAYIYGSKRQINDIDFYIDFRDLEKIKDELKYYITQEPFHYKDESWNIIFMKLLYKNQKIEIGNLHNCYIKDKKRNIWIKQVIDLQKFTEKEFYNVKVRVMDKKRLIEYKNILGREVDIQDIQNIVN